MTIVFGKIIICPHVSTICDVFPAVRFYIEDERIEDYDAFAISFQWIVFQLSLFIRLKAKSHETT